MDPHKKISSKKISWLFAGVALGGIALDNYIVDTGPLVCAIDPTCRTLTAGEIKLARSLFGDTIPYDDVRIFNRPSVYRLFNQNIIASVHRSNMYLTSTMGPLRYDFGVALEPSPNGASVQDDHAGDFAHELTHWWQYYRHGITYRFMSEDYQVRIERHSQFLDYNEEQQAEIVKFYFNQRRTITDFKAHAADPRNRYLDENFRNHRLREDCVKLYPYESKLRQVLPLPPFAACQNQ